METLTILSLSVAHIIVLVLIVLLLFGGKKIPELMKGLGSGIKEFKDAVKEDEKPTQNSNSDNNQNQNNSSTNP